MVQSHTWSLRFVSCFISFSITFSLLILFLLISAASSFGQTLSGRFYDQSSGLTDYSATQIVQTATGAVYINTQSQAFLFDGQHFLPLGEKQGIKGSPVFASLSVGPGGRSIVGSQGNRLLVARDIGALAYQDLSFSEVQATDSRVYHDYGGMTPYDDGMVVLAQTGLAYLDLRDLSKPHLTPLPAAIAKAGKLFDRALAIFGDGHLLWGSLPNGTICLAGGSNNRCWGAAEGLPSEHWGGFAKLPSGEVVARSIDHVVWLEPNSFHVRKIVSIPEMAAGYDGATITGKIFVTAAGDLMTSIHHGVAVLHHDRWKTLILASGANTVSTLLIDHSNSLWIGVFGFGVWRYSGYDVTESWTTETGLSSNLVWGLARAGDRTFIATDNGLDLLRDTDSTASAFFEARPTVSVAVAPDGALWLSLGDGTVERIDTEANTRTQWQLSNVGLLRAAPDGTIWVPTGHGLYRFEQKSGHISGPFLSSQANLSVTDVAIDPDGGLWLTGSGALWHRTPTGVVQAIVHDWPEQGVSPEVAAHKPGGPVWVGTLHGLYQVDLMSGRPVVQRVPDEYLPSGSIMAVLLHSDGSVWVGTGNGVAVEKDGRWTTLDTYDGLIGNDIAAIAMIEDNDGSVWIATSRGVTHVTRPEAILQQRPLSLTLLSKHVNNKPYHGTLLDYGPARLELAMGVFDNPLSGRIRFRFRMEGVDPQWTEFASSPLIYPSLPSGSHTLLVEAYDPVRGIHSPPQSVRVAMREPWWRQPWAYVLEVLAVAAMAWCLLRIRTAYLVNQRQALAAQVSARTQELESRTMELEEARQRLEVLAQRDSLTGLFNRRAVRDQFDEMCDSTRGTLSVALIDVDHFKRINDTHGHLGGDAVLVEIARRFEHAFIPGEVAGRFGGEEYVVLIPGAPVEAADRLRHVVREVADRPVFFGARIIRFTVSGGIAAVAPGEIWEKVLERADEALYEAKRAGRDLVLEAVTRPRTPKDVTDPQRV